MNIAIDPGASGGIAWRDNDGATYAIPMPDGMTAQVDALREIVAVNPGITATVEQVGGYMPGNAGPGAVKFARHCGHLEAALYCMGVSVSEVPPSKWMVALGHGVGKYLPAGCKDMAEKERKRARAAAVRLNKNAIKEHMARLHPHIAVTLKTSDALGILAWAEKGGAK